MTVGERVGGDPLYDLLPAYPATFETSDCEGCEVTVFGTVGGDVASEPYDAVDTWDNQAAVEFGEGEQTQTRTVWFARFSSSDLRGHGWGQFTPQCKVDDAWQPFGSSVSFFFEGDGTGFKTISEQDYLAAMGPFEVLFQNVADAQSNLAKRVRVSAISVTPSADGAKSEVAVSLQNRTAGELRLDAAKLETGVEYQTSLVAKRPTGTPVVASQGATVQKWDKDASVWVQRSVLDVKRSDLTGQQLYVNFAITTTADDGTSKTTQVPRYAGYDGLGATLAAASGSGVRTVFLNPKADAEGSTQAVNWCYLDGRDSLYRAWARKSGAKDDEVAECTW